MKSDYGEIPDIPLFPSSVEGGLGLGLGLGIGGKKGGKKGMGKSCYLFWSLAELYSFSLFFRA